MKALRGVVELLAIAWREDRGRLSRAVPLMLLQSASLPLVALCLRALTNAVVGGIAPGEMALAIVLAALVISALTAGHFAHILYFELGDVIGLRLQRRLIAISNGSVGLEHHERAEYADKLQVLRQELARTGSRSLEAVLGGLGLGVAIVITAVLLGMLEPWLLLLPVASVPSLLAGRRAEAVLARARESAAPATRLARHLFLLATSSGSAKELRVCGLESEVRARQAGAWRSASTLLASADWRASRLRIAGQIVFASAYVGATLLVMWGAVSGHRALGDVILTIALAAQVNQQVTAAVTLHQEFQRLARTLEDLRWMEALVALPGPIVASRVPPDDITSGITFKGVSFSYPGTERRVLEDVNLHLPAGATVAIVGENGAGKTTLVKLLCGFYQCQQGTIELDGVDLRQFSPLLWRERIAAGFQDFVKFELRARETVGVGHLPEIESAASVLAALRRARSEEILERLDDGLEAELGKSNPNGTELSGGQWQKLALGRAMMRDNPLLLLLDEPTAALDARAEHVLFEQYALNARRVGRATGAITVLVSHRFSTVRMADRIVVVDDNRIRAVGTHDELMHGRGLYAELYSLQEQAYR